jgi:secreted trypsin-like serine protease
MSSCSLFCLHTTAGCVLAKKIPVTKVGVNFTGYADQSYAHKRNVIEVVIHQTYNTSDIYYEFNDIALLFLDSPITTEISPLQLNTEVFGVPTDGQALKAIGLGYTYANRTNLANDLMEVDLPKFNDESCKGIYYDYDYNIDTKTTVCAGGEQGEDICRGDSGNQHTSSIATTKPFSFV